MEGIDDVSPARNPGTYHAYILRCWREEAAPGGELLWRYSLAEITPEKRQQGFGSLEALLAFLRQQLSDRGE